MNELAPRNVLPLSVALALAVVGLVGCVMPGAQRIVGPDGSPMLHVHCGSDQSECFRLAGESCPTGYDYAPVYEAKDGNFFVRCRQPVVAALPRPIPAPAPEPQVTPAPQYFAAPASAAPPPAAPAVGDWPPGEVGKPTEPWGAPSTATATTAVPGAALPPTPRTELGDVDVGY